MEDDAETRLTADEYLAEVLKTPAMFDSQLYMFEASGALVSTLFSMPEIQAASLQTVTKPLLERLSTCLQTPLTGTPVDYRNILTVHHCIQALGSIPKGFPEFPSPIPAEYIMPPIAEFRQMSEAILISLDMMGGFRIVREAVNIFECSTGNRLNYFTGSFLVWSHNLRRWPDHHRVYTTPDGFAALSL